jgi:hypothetical protein
VNELNRVLLEGQRAVDEIAEAIDLARWWFAFVVEERLYGGER